MCASRDILSSQAFWWTEFAHLLAYFLAECLSFFIQVHFAANHINTYTNNIHTTFFEFIEREKERDVTTNGATKEGAKASQRMSDII